MRSPPPLRHLPSSVDSALGNFHLNSGLHCLDGWQSAFPAGYAQAKSSLVGFPPVLLPGLSFQICPRNQYAGAYLMISSSWNQNCGLTVWLLLARSAVLSMPALQMGDVVPGEHHRGSASTPRSTPTCHVTNARRTRLPPSPLFLSLVIAIYLRPLFLCFSGCQCLVLVFSNLLLDLVPPLGFSMLCTACVKRAHAMSRAATKN